MSRLATPVLACVCLLVAISQAQTSGSPFTNPSLSTVVSGANTVITATFTNGISQLSLSNFQIMSAAGTLISLGSASIGKTSDSVWTLTFPTSVLSASTTYYVTFLNSPPVVCPPPVLQYTQSPSTVIGTGTPASCTFASLSTAATAGGIITFNCGPQPVTIAFTATINLVNNVTIDGGSRIIFDGLNTRRCFTINGVPGSGNPSFEFTTPTATFLNLVFVNAKSTAPALSGTDGGGAAIIRTGGLLQVQNCLFHNCNGQQVGQDHAGGAIYSIGGKGQTVISSIVTGSSCSNGGAMASIGSNAAYYNSIFTGNKATGYDANPGNGGNGGAICYDGGNVTMAICGSHIRGNTAGALGTVFRVGYNNINDVTTLSKIWLDNNISNRSAAGLYLQHHQFSVTETTISNSVASGFGAFQIILGNRGNSFDYLTVYNVKAGVNGENLCAAGSFAAPQSTSVPGASWSLNHFVAWQNNGTFAALCTQGSPLTLANSALQNYQNNGYERWNCFAAASGTGPVYQWPRYKYGTVADQNCSATNTIFPGDLGLGALTDNGCAVPTITRPVSSPVPTSVTAGCSSPAPTSGKVTNYVRDLSTNWPLHWPVTGSFVTAAALGTGISATTTTVTSAATGNSGTTTAQTTTAATAQASTTQATTVLVTTSATTLAVATSTATVAGPSATSSIAISTTAEATTSEVVASSTATASAASTTSTAAAATTDGSTVASGSSKRSNGGGKLSGGAIAGIVIAVLVLAAIVVAVLVYVLVFRKPKDDFNINI